MRRQEPKAMTPNRGRIIQIAAALSCLSLAALLFLALFSSPAGSEAGSLANRLWGSAATLISEALEEAFGWGAFWPAVALLGLGWHWLRGRSLTKISFWRLAGALILLFSSLAFLSLWPALDGAGGAFGASLGEAARRTLGRVLSLALLGPLALLGLLILFPSLTAVLASVWRSEAGSAPKAPRPDPGLEAEPRREQSSKSPKIKSAKPELPEDDEPDEIRWSEPEPVAPRIADKIPRRQPEPATAPVAEGGYKLPSSEFLDPPHTDSDSGLSREELMANARLLESKLRDFGVDGRVAEVSSGPVITMYEYQPAPGVKISKVAGLADDLAMAMRAASIRVVAPLPGKAAIGIEIPNPSRSLVSFRNLIESEAFQKSKSPLSLVLGVDIMGEPVVADLAKMPHLLIAGATGSGKSVGLGAMIMSILYKAGPERVRFLMIDPKCVELALYKDIAHLIYPVMSDPSEATVSLKWAVAEMDRRYRLLAEKGVRNIESYNEKIRSELKGGAPPRREPDSGQELTEPPGELPFLVIIIDELADLMMVAAKEVEVSITRLAQKARAAGIHLILATQRPSVDVLTGIIKANLPTRISFQVSSRIDSRTILDQMGAEKLLGQGDMLFLPPGVAKLRRLHGAFVSDDEIKRVTDFIRDFGPPDYMEELILPDSQEAGGGDGERDVKYQEAVELVRRSQKASASYIQRCLRIGYNRAARIIEDMERDGIIGPQDGSRPRDIY